MYLQITTKCNMTCDHCCYACTKRGRHGKSQTIRDAILFAAEHDEETVSIGGGEPTLHPDFFDILKECLTEFNYVWLATNGSQTEIMFRLAGIIDGNDMPEDYDCECSDEDRDDGTCTCYEDYYDENAIYQEDKLAVALSQDYYHDPIDDRVIALWTNRAKNRQSGYEIRNVTQSASGVINAGRAKKTQVGQTDDNCICSDLFIKPTGKIKLCGCTDAPIIGDILNGIDKKWEKIIYENDEFNDTRCYKTLKRKD